MRADIAKDISYAHAAQSKAGKAMVRAMENSTGRLKLIKRVNGYEKDVAQGANFWEVIAERYGLSLDLIAGSLGNIPQKGPVILIANHPYGILDGLMMGLILARARKDFRILANDVFQRATDLDRNILPISFDATKAGVQTNLQTRKAALSYLAGGGALGVFPGGTVSTAMKPMGLALDPSWRAFTARLISKSNATVVPVYFEGQTSRLFQIASHMHSTLRLGLLINEFKTRIDAPVRLAIGEPIDQAALQARSKDAREMMDFLRRSTYELSPKPVDATGYGYEFEEKHKGAR